MKRPLLLLSLALALGAGACAAADDGVPPGRPSLDVLLASPQPFAIDDGDVRFTVEVDRGSHVDRSRETLALTRGELAVMVDPDGVMILDELVLHLEDAWFGYTASGAARYHLTDIRLSVGAGDLRLVTEWPPGGDIVHATVDAPWTLEWSMATEHGVYPLGDQVLHGITLWLFVYDDGKEFRCEVLAWSSGTVWSWADIVTFADVALDGSGAWGPLVD